MIDNVILISASIINIFIIAILIVKKKINIAIGLATIQALVWAFKMLGAEVI